MNNPVRKLITRSFPCTTMQERFEKDLGAKKRGYTCSHNTVATTYEGTHQGIDYEVEFDFTRHMGDFTYLILDRDDFTSMAALLRFYRDLKNKTTHHRYNYWST